VLKEMIALPLEHPQLFSSGVLKESLRGILLFGPPGTGKTMLAKAVADESGANFIAVSNGVLSSKWLGDGEKHVKVRVL
jgi:transitional endoplasmic reticulum ATPase